MNDLKERNPDIIPIERYDGAYKKIKFKCLIHGEEFTRSPHDMLCGKTGCKQCEWDKRSRHTLFTQDEYEELVGKSGVDVEIIGKYIGMNKPMKYRCRMCGNEWVSPARAPIYDNEGCPRCRSSKGEKSIRNWLIDNGIQFEEQKRFDGLVGTGGKKLSYDFYVDDMNMLIEYQGEFHDGTAKLATDESLEKQQEHDKRKREFAEENNIKLIEIWYYDFENIEKILSQYLLRIP